jgi:AcrR family transcriptional regulator
VEREKKECILSAATRLFARFGFKKTSVDQIAKDAGVAKGTVYYNFPSKQALFEALLAQGMDELEQRLAKASEGLAPLPAIIALVRAQLEYIAEYGPFTKLLVSEMWRTERAWRDTLNRLRERVVGRYVAALDEGVRTGALRDGLDTQVAAASIFGMVLVTALGWREFRPEQSLDEVHDTIVDLLRGGAIVSP